MTGVAAERTVVGLGANIPWETIRSSYKHLPHTLHVSGLTFDARATSADRLRGSQFGTPPIPREFSGTSTTKGLDTGNQRP